MSDAKSKENIEAIYPLSPMQEGMLFHSLSDPDSGAYFEQYTCTYKGKLSSEAYKRAWQKVVNHNPVLRTLVIWERKDRPLQVVRHEAALEWHEEDLSDESEAGRASRISEFLQQDQKRGFDFKQAPLMRMALLKLASDEYYFVWSFHHLLLDGWSSPLLFNSVFRLYEAYKQGKDIELTPAPPYKSYITWLQKQDMSHAEEYWKQVLEGFTTPTSINIGNTGTFNTDRSTYEKTFVHLSEDATSTLQSLARKHSITLNTIVQGAWAILLSKYSGEDDVLFGSTVSGRPADLPGIETIVGLFINTLPVRIKMSYESKVFDWLKQIQSQQIESRELEWSPLVEVQKWSEIPGGQALFESIIVFENYPAKDYEASTMGFTIEDERTREETNYPLTIGVEVEDQMLLNCTYDESRYDNESIENMLKHFKNALENIAFEPDQRLSCVSLLDDRERQKLVFDWNKTDVDFDEQYCIHSLVDKITEDNGQMPALHDDSIELSYEEMSRRANTLAYLLRNKGVSSNVCVGVFLNRSAHLPVALLAVLKAGGAYLPIDPTYPEERIKFMLSDSGAPILISELVLLNELTDCNVETILIDDFWADSDEIALLDASNDDPDNLAYVIYTSGSTGLPKGVEITHRSLHNLVNWHHRAYQVTSEDRASLLAGLAFDATVWEIWPYLTAGASLYIPEDDVRLSPPATLNWLIEKNITICFLPTPLAEAILLEDVPGELSLRYLLTGGDKLHSPPCKDIPFKLINHYGPTENTVVSTAVEIDIKIPEKGEPSIGRPIDNTQVYVLDKNRHPVPVGVPGELYVAGIGLALGYVNREELTASVFVEDLFSGKTNSRMYRTGDLVRYLHDGNLIFLGRIDHQVKIHGYRIELGEIESVLNQMDAIYTSAVIVHQGQRGEKHLVAYLVAENDEIPSNAQIRNFLKEKLPVYMVPVFYISLDELPLTRNGKVDRKALPEPDVNKLHSVTNLTAARNEVEQRLVEIWCGALSLDQVGIHENFFELGGDSILSIQIISRAKKHDIHITPKLLFQNPTIAELASVAKTKSEQKSEQGLITGDVAFTPIQQWFFDQELPAQHHWNQAYLLELPSDIKTDLLIQSLQFLLVHHDALRFAYSKDNDLWQQYNKPSAELAFETVDLSQIAQTQQSKALEDKASVLQSSLDLESGKLVQAALFNMGNTESKRLLIAIHHLVVDGVSWRILLEDLETVYRQLEAGEKPVLPEKTLSFKAWAEKQHAYAQSETFVQELEYWEEFPAAAPSIPVDHGNGQENTRESEKVIVVTLEKEETRLLLQDVPSAYNTQINDVLLTALAQAFLNWTGHSTLTLNMEGHGREELGEALDISRTVGWFTSLYPVALQLEASMTVAQALMSIKEQLRCIPNRGVGFGILRYLSNEDIQHSLGKIPEPQLLFNYLGQFDQMLGDNSLINLATESSGITCDSRGTRKHLLEINSLVVDGQLKIELSYSKNLHKRKTIEKLANNLIESLQQIITHCLQPGVGSCTSSDFPLAKLDHNKLDHIISLAVDSATDYKDIEDIYPLSPMQEGMFYHTLLEPEQGFYCEQYQGVFRVAIDQRIFKQAWQLVLDRNTILRSAFFWDGLDFNLQVVYRHCELPFTFLDWREHSRDEQESLFSSFLSDDNSHHFELDKAPLLRICLIQIDDEEYRFVWSYHHLLLDGWSIPIFLSEVLTLYNNLSRNEVIQLPRSRPYRDYIAWLNEQDDENAEKFWKQFLAGYTAPASLDALEKAEKSESNLFEERQFKISEQTSSKLQQLVQKSGITLNTFFQGLWGILLSRYSGDKDIVFGTTVSGRPAEMVGIEGMLGLFINTLPMRIQIDDGEQSLFSWLKKVQQQQLDIREYEYSSLANIHSWCDMPHDQPLFESLFIFENYPIDENTDPNGLHIHDAYMFERNNLPLSIMIQPGPEIILDFFYSAARFDGERINRIAGHLENLVDSIISEPEQKIKTLPVLTEHEHQLFKQWNATTVNLEPHVNALHHLFEMQEEKNPSAVAVSFEGNSWTNCELNERANQLAHFLRSLDVGSDVIVGVCMERSLEMSVALLAVLKAGGAYLPLDPTLPKEPLAFMLDDTEAKVILTQDHLRNRLPDNQAQLFFLDLDTQIWKGQPKTNIQLEQQPAPDSLFNVIFTSGSTGKPKGVMVTHEGIINRLLWMQQKYPIDSGDIILQKTPYNFDVSVWELFWPLITGAQLVYAKPDGHKDPDYLREIIHQYGITILHFVPSMLAIFLQSIKANPNSSREQCRSIRKVFCSGEALEIAQQRGFFEELGFAELHNLYGPTEASVDVSYFQCQPDNHYKSVPIGKPVANTQLHVLDRNLQLLPVGVVGELYIGGVQLARGYLNREELTSKTFINNPFYKEGHPSKRLYKTGDLARYLADGNIEYFGRVDFQVKLRGFRIELGEIEAVLASHPNVNQTAVTLREDSPGDKRLVAYCMSQSDDFAATSLRKYLRTKLPNYMIPQHFVKLDKFPLTPNGKIDRLALPALFNLGAVSDNFISPGTENEKMLASIWENILKIEKVGIHDNFFEIGGHSLLSIQVIASVRDKTGIKLELRPIVMDTLEQIALQFPETRGGDQNQAKVGSETFFGRMKKKIKSTLYSSRQQ